jgi:DNA replication and repair protein RecF
MTLKTLELVYFRNFTQAQLEFPASGILVVNAPNAAGKTNFLESIVLLLRGKSWRASAEQCVQWGHDGFRIQGEIDVGEPVSTELSVQYELATRGLHLKENSAPVSLVTFYTKYPLIVFLPEDTFLFTRGPEQRRNFFNTVLVSVPSYLSALVQYGRVLKQRNAALKSARGDGDVANWTQLLHDYALVLWKQRELFTEFIATHLNSVYGALSGENHEFTVALTTSVASNRYWATLEESAALERRVGHTLHGPHRDDLIITVHDKPVRAVFSQGQLANVSAALKVVGYRFLQHVTQQVPLLLLDEVLSELDERRQQVLLEHLPAEQTIITATSVPAAVRKRSNVHVLDVRSLLTGEGPGSWGSAARLPAGGTEERREVHVPITSHA